jgi:hypothetical protein
MDNLNQVEESRRLKELYARMNDGDLEVVADEAYDLTDVAKPLLKDEIDRRGLKIQLRVERPRRSAVASRLPTRPPIDLELQEIRVFETLEEARQVRELLNTAGIPCFWGPGNFDDPGELALSVDDGLHMKVRSDDVARVREGLGQFFAGEVEDPDAGDCNFVCPKCHSPEIVFQDLDATKKFNWSCDECGHTWNDDGVEQEG